MKSKKLVTTAFTILILSILLYSNAFAGEKEVIRAQLENIAESYNSSFYAALFLIPEMKQVTVSSFRKAYGEIDLIKYSVYPVTHYSKYLNSEQKSFLLNMATDYLVSNPKVISKIRYWCIADSQFRIILEYTYGENLMAAVYTQNITKDLFNNIISNRRIAKDKVTADWIGETLTSSEDNEIYNNLLNKVADLSEKEQIRYFVSMFNYINTSKNEEK